jgi:hypothetical protein
MRYRELTSQQIVTTAERLSGRISERFPASGLSRVSAELLAVARESEARLDFLGRPYWPIRIGVGLALVVLAILIISSVVFLPAPVARVGGIAELLQAVDAAVNDVIFLCIGVFFLLRIEDRFKRRAALRALHELRSIAHIVDMHQLTKDPEHVLSPEMQQTASSPKRTMTRFELARYLDYCSELLSLTSKLAALHLQKVNDPVVLDAVNDIQTLAIGLSGKIWQKIMILDAVAPVTAVDSR